jgi:hypothetical protein
MMENMDVPAAREIEASLHERIDTQSIADVREAAQEAGRSAEEAMVTAQAMAAAGMEPEPLDAQDTLSELEAVEPAGTEPEIQKTEPAADEQPTAVIRPEWSEPIADEPHAQDPEVVEPEVEPSTAQDGTDQTGQEPPASEPEAASEVEREEPSLAEESSSGQFFDREEGEPSDSRVSRASRFLRRRE